MNHQQAIEDIVRYVRSRLQVSTESSHFIFSIEAKGNTHVDEVEVKIELDETYKFNVRVNGGDLDFVIDEHLRRLDWNKHNSPLCLPNVKTIETKPETKRDLTDEIPF